MGILLDILLHLVTSRLSSLHDLRFKDLDAEFVLLKVFEDLTALLEGLLGFWLLIQVDVKRAKDRGTRTILLASTLASEQLGLLDTGDAGFRILTGDFIEA